MAVHEDHGDEYLLSLSARRPEVFARFYERHAEAVLRFFARRTLDPDLAAELTAETFAQAFASRRRYVARGSEPVAWLFGIARHQLGRYFRRGFVDARAKRKLGLPERDLSDGDYERIEELMDLKQVRGAIAETFANLSGEQRDALALRVVEGRSYLEVAQELGCSEQAARARVSRGLSRMTRILETEYPELMKTAGGPA